MKYSAALGNTNHTSPLSRTIIEASRCKPNFSTYSWLGMLAGFLYLFVATFAGVLFLFAHFTINQSASMPVGLYRITHEPIQRGSLVLLKEPLKEIVAVPGDTVTWSAKGVSINGRLLKNSAVPSGSPYPPYPYTTLKLAEDQYVAMGRHHPLSYDARYVGPTPASLIASTATPVWTRK